METDKNYFLVGIFVVVLILAGLGFTLWLTSAGKGDYVQYFVRFSESVSGLSDESIVKFRGVDVGNIEKIAIDADDSRLVRVDMRILKSTPVKADTVASLKLRGITGDIYIDLTGGTPDEPNLASGASKDEAVEIRAGQSSISAIMDRLPHIMEKIDHIVSQADKIFSDKNVEGVNGVVQNLSSRYGKKAKDETPAYPNSDRKM